MQGTLRQISSSWLVRWTRWRADQLSIRRNEEALGEHLLLPLWRTISIHLLGCCLQRRRPTFCGSSVGVIYQALPATSPSVPSHGPHVGAHRSQGCNSWCPVKARFAPRHKAPSQYLDVALTRRRTADFSKDTGEGWTAYVKTDHILSRIPTLLPQISAEPIVSSQCAKT